MTDSLPSPPESRPTTPRTAQDSVPGVSLVSRLDELLEQYLELLDRYTTLRKELSEHFSSGFFSLAHAQRISNLGVGRRYGQDGYDGRMKALRRVVIARTTSESSKDTTSSSGGVGASLTRLDKLQLNHEVRIATHEPRNDTAQQSKPEDDKPHAESDTGKMPPQDQGEVSQTSQAGATEPTQRRPKIDPAFRDPATWFSILVPQSLRKSQSSFVTLVSETLPQIVNTVARMETVENHIWNLRSRLGTEHDKESPAEDPA